MDNFPPGVGRELKHYVYRLIDPRNGHTFYVGRGQGNRIFAHARAALKLENDEDAASTKLDHIRKLEGEGLKPIHVVHRHGLNRKEAVEVEAALIDCYPGLTNEVAGEGSFERGPATVQQIATQHGASVMEPDENHRLLYIKTKSGTVAEVGLYEAVRKSWKISDRVEVADYVIAVVDKVCRGIFVAERWELNPENGRRYFYGREASDEVSERYRDRLIPPEFRKKGMAAPVLFGW